MACNEDFVIESGILTGYLGSGGDVTVPDGVTAIGSKAFSGCKALTSVTIPDSGVEIGERAFYDCRALTDVTIPGSVTEIGESAFSFCTSLTDLVIPGSVKRIGEMAFWFCESLTKATLAEGVTCIASEAFRGCRRLKEAVLPSSLTDIGHSAFCDCTDLETISVPRAVTKLFYRTFRGCQSLISAALPDELTEIGKETFYLCYSLRSIRIPAGLTSIPDEAFASCISLRSITIPANISEIGSSAFSYYKRLTSVAIPDSVREVGEFAFADCTGLASAALPDDARGFEAFSGCTSLKEFIISPESRTCKTVDGVVLSKDGKVLIAYPPGRECDRYDIPGTVRKVGDKAFWKAPVKLIFAHKEVESFSNTAAPGMDNDDPYVAFYNAAFTTPVGKPVYLGPPGDVLSRHRRTVMFGFLHALSIGLPEMKPWEESYVDVMRRNPEAFAQIAWRNEALLRLLMDRCLLSADTAGKMIRIFSGEGRSDLVSELKNYLLRDEMSP